MFVIKTIKLGTYKKRFKIIIPNNMTLIYFPGARDCLKHLSELSCTNDVCSKFFYQLSQVCHNIQSLKIPFESIFATNLCFQ